MKMLRIKCKSISNAAQQLLFSSMQICKTERTMLKMVKQHFVKKIKTNGAKL